MKRGAFFVLEGIDASGKSTRADRLAERVRKELGRECVVTAEPSTLWPGDAVRRANREGIDDAAEALLFVADRALHTGEIQGWMAEGKVVVCDRYYASTIAYQSAALQDRMADPTDWLWELNRPVAPLVARHVHEEFNDHPVVVKGFFAVLCNNEFIMQRIGAKRHDQARDYVAWLLQATKAYAIKLVNPAVWNCGSSGAMFTRWTTK